MNVYTTDKIRNVVLLGHSGSGKTSLVEAMRIWQVLHQEWGKQMMATPSAIMERKNRRDIFLSQHL